MLFVGDDWAEDHHDVALMDESGGVLIHSRLSEGVSGVAAFHALVAKHASDPEEVVICIETDRGLWVQSLVGAGYQVYAVNPRAAAHYRERHVVSGAKSDRGDAKTLANLVRTDRQHHRQVAGDSETAQAVRALVRAHQRLIWDRQAQVNRLRSVLREFYPAALEAFGSDLAHADAIGVLERAPTPGAGARLSISALSATLRRAGRQRNIEDRAKRIQSALRTPQVRAPWRVEQAYGVQVAAMTKIIAEMTRQIAGLEAQLTEDFESHPDAEIIRSLPGLGTILGARVLGEFGDDPNRYADSKARRNYAGTSPLTKTSGKRRLVLARFVRNRHLADATYRWAFASLQASSGARAFYDQHRGSGGTHDQALRALSNRLVGILDGCLRSRSGYNETVAWGHRQGLSSGVAA